MKHERNVNVRRGSAGSEPILRITSVMHPLTPALLVALAILLIVDIVLNFILMRKFSTSSEPSANRVLRVVGIAPEAAHPGDAGLDLRYDPAAEPITLHPGERKLLPTGTRIALPSGSVGLVCPRSGLAAKHGIGVVNGPGVVDSGYRGEVCVNLINHGTEQFTVEPGMRIAQLVITPFIPTIAIEADRLDDTERSAAGFGSTGTA